MEKKKKKGVVCEMMFILLLVWFGRAKAEKEREVVKVKVGVIVNFETMDGKRGRSCIDMALSHFYSHNPHFKTRLLLHYRDSHKDVVVAADAALDLIKNVQVQAILGPDSSMQANFIIQLGDKAQVPIITYTATSPSLTSIRSQYFIRATQNDSSQVKAISAIVQAFGWREAVFVYVDNEYGEGIIPYLTNALENVDTQVPYLSVIPPNISDAEIVSELYKLMTMQTRVFIVHMLPSLGSRLFTKAKEVGMMNPGYVWITTNGITNQMGSLNSTVIGFMQGVLGVKTYVPRTRSLENFRVQWKRKFEQDNPAIIDPELDNFGLWAHDAAVALALAVERAGTSNITFQNKNGSSTTTDLQKFGVSQYGKKLQQELSNASFRGLTGDHHLVNGHLQSSTFQIVNINGNGWTGLGFWTPSSGLVKKLSLANTSSYSTSRTKLGAIIWPGESTSTPKGWEIPTSEKKLRIGVPIKVGFTEFVKVTHDHHTNTTIVTGYCIDVFKAIMEAMPYAVPYDLIPFENPNGQSAGTYNDLVFQVYLQKFDAVVGDITIVANRSQYVDFTLPYTESGVSIIVPVKDDHNRKKAWVFLEPLTWNLWVAIGSSFLIIAFMVWVLEHKDNTRFQGSISEQVIESLLFSFSTMVFAHRPDVDNGWTKTLVIVWCFVVFIFTQSYTASLTSRLTAQQLQPTITDMNQLLRDGAFIGCRTDSFLLGMLTNLGFLERNIRAFETQQDLAQLFSNGSIAAAFDEIPYLKFFLAQKCSQYTMIDPTFRTNGFGFVFPKGSPLVADVSRAILAVAEGGNKMANIEKEWLGPKDTCVDHSTPTSTSLSPESFGGLFFATAIATSSIVIGGLLHQHWQAFRDVIGGILLFLLNCLVAIGAALLHLLGRLFC